MRFRKINRLRCGRTAACHEPIRRNSVEPTLQRRAVTATPRGAIPGASPTRAYKTRNRPARDSRRLYRRQGNSDQRRHRSVRPRNGTPHSIRLRRNGSTRGRLFRRVTVPTVTRPVGDRPIDRQIQVGPMLRTVVSSLKRIAKPAIYPFSILSVVSQSMHGSVIERPYCRSPEIFWVPSSRKLSTMAPVTGDFPLARCLRMSFHTLT